MGQGNQSCEQIKTEQRVLIPQVLGRSSEGQPYINSEGRSAMAFLSWWVDSLEGVWELALETARCPPPGGVEEPVALPRALEPGSPQQGIDIFSFPQALGLAGVRPRYKVGGEWLVDTRVAFCKSKLCPSDTGSQVLGVN